MTDVNFGEFFIAVQLDHRIGIKSGSSKKFNSNQDKLNNIL
ncbi:MAG: hypothetical protein AB8B68_05705 [Rickettsiaceae bacterium]